MADNVAITPGTGATVAADDIAGVHYQRVKQTWGPDGTANDTDVATGKPLPVQLRVSDGTALTFGSGALAAGTLRVVHATDDPVITAINTGVATAIPAGTNNIGDVDVLTVPADPFGVNADAASATGSISAKLRFIAATGIPVTGTVTVGSHAVTNAGTFATQSTLQAGTAAFGKLAANSGVDIGDVDVTSLPALAAGTNNIGHVGGTEYELVAASQTTQSIGATGATGDYLSHVLIVPETTAAGTVAIKDGAGTAINIFVAGTLSNLVPFTVGIGAKSAAGAWQITTGANVHCIAFGDFT